MVSRAILVTFEQITILLSVSATLNLRIDRVGKYAAFVIKRLRSGAF
jgi:hypothetical protein